MTAFLAGHWELLVVVLVVLVLFGHRIPGMARALGSGIVEFKKGLRGDDDSPSSKISDSSGSAGGASPTDSARTDTTKQDV